MSLLSSPSLPDHAPAACRDGERGFGLLEVALALLVIAVATLGSVSWTLSGMNLEKENRERADGHDALRQLVEEIQALPFDEVFARCNADPADDPDGAGTARGGRFTIESTRADRFLDATYVAPESVMFQRARELEVTIEFPVDVEGRLVESAQGSDWGDQAWDLDGNGEISSDPLTGTYQLLPVYIRVDWIGAGGPAHVSLIRLLGRRVRPEADV